MITDNVSVRKINFQGYRLHNGPMQACFSCHGLLSIPPNLVLKLPIRGTCSVVLVGLCAGVPPRSGGPGPGDDRRPLVGVLVQEYDLLENEDIVSNTIMHTVHSHYLTTILTILH